MEIVVHSSLEGFSSLEETLVFSHDSESEFLKVGDWISSDKQEENL